MYPNPKVNNHGIGNYENFEDIVNNYKELDSIIILDSEYNRKNYEFMERCYKENINKYNKKEYGDGIIVYEKVKE